MRQFSVSNSRFYVFVLIVEHTYMKQWIPIYKFICHQIYQESFRDITNKKMCYRMQKINSSLKFWVSGTNRKKQNYTMNSSLDERLLYAEIWGNCVFLFHGCLPLSTFNITTEEPAKWNPYRKKIKNLRNNFFKIMKYKKIWKVTFTCIISNQVHYKKFQKIYRYKRNVYENLT